VVSAPACYSEDPCSIPAGCYCIFSVFVRKEAGVGQLKKSTKHN